MGKIIIKEPKTPEEFASYYDLRFRILREPWGQLRGSEKDGGDDSAYHVIAIDKENNRIVGVSRLHMNNAEEGQIRYMAVEEDYRKCGAGALMINALEHKAKALGAKKIIINARENALKFYEQQSYITKEPGHTLFDVIAHFKMEKILSSD